MDLIVNELMAIQTKLVNFVPRQFKRYLFNKIDWNQRMLAITGARGTGKTTLVLQYYLEKYNDVKKCLYFSADNPLVLKKGLYNTVSEYFKYFGESVIIDEIHKQKDWAIEIKALYDAFPNKKFIILGSSKLNILNQKGDLSRRMLIYDLKSMSFREYINLKHNIKFDYFSIDDLLDEHIQISSEILGKINHIIGLFQDFLRTGSYPFILNCNEDQYFNFINNILDKIIYEDMPSIKNIKSSSSIPIKKLIAFISMSKIPTLSVSSLCNEIGVSKETLYEFLDLLERADVLNIIKPKRVSVRSIKNSKILFYSPNIYYAIANELWLHEIEIGNLRESFFVSQVKELYNIFASKDCDFTVDIQKSRSIEIEIGGKSKNRRQLKNIENGYILQDNQEIGIENKIPLYLMGFLY